MRTAKYGTPGTDDRHAGRPLCCRVPDL